MSAGAAIALLAVGCYVLSVVLLIAIFAPLVDDAQAELDVDVGEPVPFLLAEPVEDYADRELRQFACPELDQAEIKRLRAIAAADAKKVQR